MTLRELNAQVESLAETHGLDAQVGIPAPDCAFLPIDRCVPVRFDGAVVILLLATRGNTP